MGSLFGWKINRKPITILTTMTMPNARHNNKRHKAMTILNHRCHLRVAVPTPNTDDKKGRNVKEKGKKESNARRKRNENDIEIQKRKKMKLKNQNRQRKQRQFGCHRMRKI